MASDLFTQGGKIMKMEVDYSETVSEKLPICQKMAKEGKLKEALDILLALEKQTRTGSDTHSTSRILVVIVELCFEAGDFKTLNEQIFNLTKRRFQIKQSITKMIEKCCTYVDQIKDKEVQLQLIETLRTVTAGKIYVEVERARLTLKLAHMKEAEGKIDEAALILQELQVETFGSMEKKEKIELILEQMRLCLLKKDYIRAQIISKKIQIKYLDEPNMQELKWKFHNIMVELDQVEKAYLNICKHYMALYNTESIKDDLNERCTLMKHAIAYVILASFDNEQSDLIHRLKGEKILNEIPHYKEIIQLFTDSELINWTTKESYFKKVLQEGMETNELEAKPINVFTDPKAGNQRWTDLKNRVVEHNIRIMAKFYSKITLKRMAELLGLQIQDTEEALSVLVVSKTIWAKIDRSVGIVNFSASKDPNETLNDWSNNIDQLMNLVGKMNHLINKEEMIYQNYVPTHAS